jgi:hypothetical protein
MLQGGTLLYYFLKLGLVATPLACVQKYYKAEFNQVLLGIPFLICFILLANDDLLEFLFPYLYACQMFVYS